MPMSWDANADAKLFAAVMSVYDVKITGAKLDEVAKLMGGDCTAKAITHRLAKIRNNAAAFIPTTPSNRGRKAAGTKKTPSTSTKSTGKGKGTQPTLMPDDRTDDEEEEVTPLKRKAPIVKTEAGNVEAGNFIAEDKEIKKIKLEPIELEI